ncbi:MAG: glycosyltransferase [Actinomycetota bacterium]|nr:glycosyltransferase [Actinomycetota bacterium]
MYYDAVFVSEVIAVVVVAIVTIATFAILRRLKGEVPAELLDSKKTVSILIPARNEEASIGNLLASLEEIVKGAPFEVEVIVANDGSTDGTLRLCEEFDFVEVFEVSKSFVVGTNGKSNALAEAVDRSSGDVLVFIDADVVVGRNFINLFGMLDGEGAPGLISLQPFHVTRSFGEGLVLSFNIVTLTGAVISNQLRRTEKIAFGPLLVTTKDNYLATGGHRSIVSETTDDIALANSYSAHGFRVITLLDRSIATFRMYPFGFKQMVEGFSKNVLAGFKSVSLLAVLGTGSYITAVLSLDIAVARELFHRQMIVALVVYAVVTFLVACGAKMVGRYGRLNYLLHPISFLVFLFVFVRSIARSLLSIPNTWKGRPI